MDRLLLIAAGVGIVIILAAAAGALPGGVVITGHLPHGDLLVHALVYATIAAAAAILTPRWGVRAGPVRIPLAFLVVLVLALGEETLQTLDPGRRASLTDAAADVFGVFVLAPMMLRGRTWLAGRISGRRLRLRRSSPAAPAGR